MSIEQHLEALNATILRLAVALERRNLLDEHPIAGAAPAVAVVGGFPLPSAETLAAKNKEAPAAAKKKTAAPKVAEAEAASPKAEFLAQVGHTSDAPAALAGVLLAGLKIIKAKLVTAESGTAAYATQLDKVKAIGKQVLNEAGVNTVTEVSAAQAPAFLNALKRLVEANA